MAAVTEERGPMFKIVLLGEAGVGKTAVFFRLKENTFSPHLRNTIGIDSCSKHMSIDDQNLTVSRNFYLFCNNISLVKMYQFMRSNFIFVIFFFCYGWEIHRYFQKYVLS